MVVGLVVAVLAVVVMAILYFHGKPNPAPDQEQAQTAPAASTTAPDAQSGPSSAVGATHPAVLTRAEKQAAAKAAKNADKGEVKPPVAAPAPVKNEEKPPPPKAVEAPPARGGRCDLEPSEYAGQVDQAWKNLGRGRYADAQREFGAVLACDPGNARAKEGLERARLAASEAAGG
jgi:hypothetical protein